MSIVKALGVDWRNLPASENIHTGFMDRLRHISSKSGFISSVLPEYIYEEGKKVVDFSSGNGVLLEIFRHYGHDILGVDIQYFGFLDSQEIPRIEHDCRILPYPLTDNSCDLITCVGSISTYGDVLWDDVLNEFARIAKECIVIRPNQGEVLEARRHELENWTALGWKRQVAPSSNADIFKWTYSNG